MPKLDTWSRHVMDAATKKLVAERNPESMDVFEVSGKAWHDMFKWRSFTFKNYPEFDVCVTKFEQQYDLIIAEQVFEHIRYPWKAARNIFEGLKPGGYALITTPFIFPIHPTPLDCWRWTPQGMKFLLEDAGFLLENIITDGWGNFECYLHYAIAWKSAPYDGKRPIHNIPHSPVVVWGFAKKV